ncbi:MAG: hypothetical protein ACP5OO_04000 [Chloroflexia bacterium]
MDLLQAEEEGQEKFLLVYIWLFGALIRFLPLFQFPQALERPLGMGGLYHLFAREILRHGFALPERIPYYTLNGLPFAYPPLAFYLQAALLACLPVPTFVLVNILPPILSTLTVGLFFLLAREFLRGRRALLATAIYALLPAAFLEHLPGEGLVESLGTALFIAGVWALVRLNRRPGWPASALLGLFIGLTIAASPGGAYGLAVSIAVLWLFRAGGRRAPLHYLLAAAGIGLALSAPYWLTVVLRYGPDIFFRTFFRQHTGLIALLLAKMGLLVEQSLPLSPWGVLALIGLALFLARREWSLPLWCVLVYAIPREFGYLVAVPLALLATWGLTEAVLPGVAGRPERNGRPAGALVLLVLFAWGLARAYAWGADLTKRADLVTTDELAMMAWIRQHTPPEATFLVIGNEIEWFPVLSERTTLNVVWGSEWVEDESVFRLEAELGRCQLPDCCLEVAEKYGLSPDYLYLSAGGEQAGLLAQARTDPALELVWENAGAGLFCPRSPR